MKRKTERWASMAILILLVPASVEAQQGRRPLPQAQQEVLYLTHEQEEDVIDYLREARPEQADELILLKDRRPAAYQKFLSRAYREMRYMEEVRRNDPERYEIMKQEKLLESQSRELAKGYRKATEEEREGIRTELRSVLNRLFDLRQMNREFEIQRLEKRLEEARGNNRKRLENKESIIDLRMSELLKEGGMEW